MRRWVLSGSGASSGGGGGGHIRGGGGNSCSNIAGFCGLLPYGHPRVCFVEEKLLLSWQALKNETEKKL